MTNEQKYRTPEERVVAYARHEGLNQNQMGAVHAGMVFHWLALPCEEEKPMPCPFCGKECSYSVCREDSCGVVACNYCGYRSSHTATVEGAIRNHNRVARAVMAAKESEARQ